MFFSSLRRPAALLVALAVLLLLNTQAVAQRDLRDIPDPDPELERKSFIVADGFEVNLYASDPLLAKPIQMNFDADGRLWVASSEVYPHIEPGQKASDKILVLEDSNADGKADKTTVFADGLLIPTGVVPGDGGAYIVNSTELLHMRDLDGDGKADQRRIVLSGFGTEDTHHLLHTLRWGHDGALYMNQSIYIHSHIETPRGVRHLNAGGIWRFRPDTMELDVFCRGFVNPWGHHFDRWGQSFATDGAYGEGINYVFPGSVFVTAYNAKRRLRGLNPGSPKHCGLEIVSGNHLPDDWQGNMITNDFRAHRVCRFVVSEDGSGYASRQETELIKTKHVAFRPIDVKVGPDGAIYIADWYNPIIQHGEIDFRDPRRDHVHGRIWRVTAKDRPLVKTSQLSKASTDELLEHLKSNAEWQRLHAKLLLKSNGANRVIPKLQKWLAALDPSDDNTEALRLEALWVYQGLNTVNEKLLGELLKSDDHRVRAAAVRVASHWSERLEMPRRIMKVAVADEHPRVRLEAVRALAEMPSAQSATLALRALDQPMDRFLDFAVWQAMRDLQGEWLPAVRAGKLDFDGNVAHLMFALKAVESDDVVQPLVRLIEQNKVPADRADGVLTIIAELGGPKELGKVFQSLLSAADRSPQQSAKLLDALVQSSLQRKVLPATSLEQLSELFAADDRSLKAAAARAVGAWKVGSLRPQLVKLLDDSEESVQLAAVDGAALLGGPINKQLLADLASSERSFAVKQQAVQGLAKGDTSRAASLAAKLMAALPENADPSAMISSLLAKKDGPHHLKLALAEVKLRPDVAKMAVRSVQNSPRQLKPLIEQLKKSGSLDEAGWKLTPELLTELVEEAKTKGNAARGELLFRRQDMQCFKCHAIGGAGGRVGPDLVSIGASAQVDYLIESLLDPNKKIKENFHTKMVITLDGQVLTGVPVRQDKQQFVLRDAEDQEVKIPLGNIDEQQDGRSLMPDGLVDILTRSELVDLTRFLSELGKVGDFSVGKARVVRRWEQLRFTPEARHRMNRTSHDTAATNDPAFTWDPAYSFVRGELPVDKLGRFVIHRGNDPAGFVRFELDVTTPGRVALHLGDVTGLRAWVDEKPTSLAETFEFEAKKGRHRITLGIDLSKRTKPLRVELIDVDGSPAKAEIVGGK